MPDQPQRPNVLLICTDHWPGLLMRPAGHPTVMTPTLAQLARCGTRFSNAYSACPACLPARRSLLTGQSTRGHGQRTNATSAMPERPTLPQVFRDAGYQTLAVGKMHVTHPSRQRLGFDDVVLHNEAMRKPGDLADDYQMDLAARGYPGMMLASGMSNTDYMTRAWHLPEDLHPTNWTTYQMCRSLNRRDPTRPGFWFLSYITPHPPLTPLQAYLDLYRDVPLDEPVMGEWARDFEKLPYSLRNQMVQFAIHEAPKHEADLARRAFYAVCTHIDHQVRVVIGYLSEQGLLNNTLIVFMSDHGDMLGDHGLWAKGQFHEMSAKIPLLVVPPRDNPRGLAPEPGRLQRVDDRLAEVRDVMPTLLNFCGIGIPETVEGVSLLSERRRESLYGELEQDARATRMMHDGRFKLIWFPCGNHVQLFDTAHDPRDLYDLADDPKHSADRARLTKLLIEHLYDTDERWHKNGQLIGEPDRPAQAGLLLHQRGIRFM